MKLRLGANIYKTEAILLQRTPFGERDQIALIFTEIAGLVRLHISGKTLRTQGLEPLMLADFVITQGRGELSKCQECTVLNRYPKIRKTLETVEAACELVNIIRASQPTGKPIPALYSLLQHYLESLPENPTAFALSFRLKVLRHEGLLSLSTCQCGEIPSFMQSGESFCHQHTPVGAIPFNSDEFALLDTLAYSRSPALLAAQPITPSFAKKVRHFLVAQ